MWMICIYKYEVHLHQQPHPLHTHHNNTLATSDYISMEGEYTCIASSDWWHYTIHYNQGTGSDETWSDCISTQVMINDAGDDSTA